MNKIILLIIGVIVISFSVFVNNRTDSNSLILFIIIGVGMIIYALFDLLTKIILKDDKKPKGINNTKKIIECKVCKTRHYSSSNFCHMCGTKLIK